MMNAENRHLLMLVHRIPYPPDKGDKIRSWNELFYLEKKGWKIHLCTFIDDHEDWKHVEKLRRRCSTLYVGRQKKIKRWLFMGLALLQGKPLSVGAFFDGKALGFLDRVMREHPVDAVLCFSSPMAEYVFRSPILKRGVERKRFGKRGSESANAPVAASEKPFPRLVMDLCDVDSEKWRLYSQKVYGWRRWIYRLEAARLRSYEIEILDAFDRTVVVSQAEADFLKKSVGGSDKVFSVNNGVDTDYFHPATEVADRTPCNGKGPVLVFCGVMDYHPNIDAVEWFAEEVLPVLRKRFGEVAFDIVGAKPVKRVRDLARKPGVRVLGRVDDVRPYVWRADVSVAPLRIARGVQNKVLEAMAMGMPVAATREAFEGIDALPCRDLIVSEAKPLPFADAVSSLLENKDLAKRMGEEARRTILRKYGWERKLENLDRFLL